MRFDGRIRPQVDAYLLGWILRDLAKTSVVFRNARWQLSIDRIVHSSVVRNDTYVGTCCRTDCGIGDSRRLVQFSQAESRTRSTNSADAAHETRG